MDVDMPPGMRDRDWIPFSGTVTKQTEHELTLVPNEDAYIRIIHSPQDVHVAEDNTPNVYAEKKKLVFVRRGARYLRFEIEPLSTFSGRATRKERCSDECPGGCKCVGNIEYCCGGSRIAVGSCHGEWGCSDP